MADSLQPCGLQPTRLLCLWGFSRQEYYSVLPCPPAEDFPNPGIEPRSPALQADSLPAGLPEKPCLSLALCFSFLRYCSIFYSFCSTLGNTFSICPTKHTLLVQAPAPVPTPLAHGDSSLLLAG